MLTSSNPSIRAIIAPSSSPPSSSVTLLDPKRANNLNISLAQYRKITSGVPPLSDAYGCGWEALVRAVYALDPLALPRPLLDQLVLLMPTTEDLSAVKAFKGDPSTLMDCDKFYRLLATSVPRFPAKVSAVALRAGFDATAADVSAKAAVLTTACTQVVRSSRLQAVLTCVLAIGNVLNEGVESLQADAIRLESLLKLSSTKSSVDKKTTLMDALVVMVERKGGGLLEWAADLSAVVPSSSVVSAQGAPLPPSTPAPTGAGGATLDVCRLELPEIRSDLGRLKTGLALMAREGEAEEGDAGAGAHPTHPVGHTQRRVFAATLRAFAGDASATLALTEAHVVGGEVAAKGLAECFAEDPRTTPPSAVFAVLRRFAADFASAARLVQARRARDMRSAVAGSGGGGPAPPGTVKANPPK